MLAGPGSLLALLVVAAAAPGAQKPAPARGATPPAIVADTGPRKPIRRTTECLVTRIVDGDTLDCRDIGRVRLIGIDAPEASQKPFGTASTAALRSLVPVGARAQLEQDVEVRDRYGRTLGYIWIKGRMVNWLLIRSGWAVLLTYPPNVQYVNAFRSGGQLARVDQLGLWRIGGFDCSPIEHRRKRC